ncbi:MAG: choice-of-anchor L domain-containing protein [Weeksellaceae bacterium]|jgi:gliding motility-associated-like protein|nr:choice-of-anchor L domain-containing protein [Weeksellaceae bacterium]
MRAFFFICTLTLSTLIPAQSIIINPVSQPESNYSAEELTREVLVSGNACSDISNFQLKDNPSAVFPSVNRSWGYFEKGSSTFPFERGIVLTSGYAKSAEGPNTGIVGDGDYNWTGDGNANTLAGGSTNNATVFEFDFIPFGSEIAFNYIFASEEYPTFACSSYNDVFGFIISGPGITNDPGLNGKNIARLPNGLPVTINNVNNNYCGDATYYVPGPFPYIEHGGRTTVLTAYSEVIPGETYHIRLLIADTADTNYDSAVFLEAGSFNLGSTLVDIYGDEIEDGKLICDLEEYTLIANVTSPVAVFQWYFNGELIPGATENQYIATETGNYSVEVSAVSCQTEADVNLIFSKTPEAVLIYEAHRCSLDGTYLFDLSEFNSSLSTTNDIHFTYYTSNLGAQTQNPNSQIIDFENYFVNTTGTVYVRIEADGGCYVVVPLILSIGKKPDTQEVPYPICDTNGDGFATFDLNSQNNLLITSDPTGLTFEYYLDAGLTQLIPNPDNFVNTSNPQIVFVKAYYPDEADEECIAVEELTLIVEEFPELQSDNIVICDNLHDGSEEIDLTQNNIVITSGIGTTLHYFTEIGGQEITNPESYLLTSSPVTFYVLVRNTNESCEDYQTLTVSMLESPEVISDTIHLQNCSLTQFSTYYLPDANSHLVNSTNGLTFTYHFTYQQAFNGTNPLPQNYQNTSPNQIVYVRIQNSNQCFDIGEIQLNTVTIHEELPDALTVCDNPYETNDGFGTFNLTQMYSSIATVLGGGNYFITYHTSLDDAVSGNNPIINPTEYENISNPQTIYTRAKSNQGCAGIVDFKINVLSVPEFELRESITFCANDFDKSFEFFDPFESYTWYNPSGDVVSTESLVVFNQQGTYTLEVTSPDSQCVGRREINVQYDAPPVISSIVVDENTVTVYANGGFGPYLYSYTNGLNWSDHSILYDIPPGIYEMIIKSKYGCISDAKIFGVLGVPNFFSPNGDGINDTWRIRALEVYPNTQIKIFDRYGKLFVDRPLISGFEWDGTYGGRPVPSGDYWYIITLEDGRMIKGHITVRH